ncbi:MAG: hypothetical protein IH891_04645 [Planctomycetes bacterium]|nr:hypothetical protein [Planctomycetota bacterium]
MVTFVNNMKTAVLLAALFGLLVWVGSIWGDTRGMIIFGAIAVVINFTAWFASDKIAVAAMRGVEVREGSGAAPGLHGLVRDLAKRAELPMPRVYVCPQDAPNAFATGRNPHHAAVAARETPSTGRA